MAIYKTHFKSEFRKTLERFRFQNESFRQETIQSFQQPKAGLSLINFLDILFNILILKLNILNFVLCFLFFKSE